MMQISNQLAPAAAQGSQPAKKAGKGVPGSDGAFDAAMAQAGAVAVQSQSPAAAQVQLQAGLKNQSEGLKDQAGNKAQSQKGGNAGEQQAQLQSQAQSQGDQGWKMASLAAAQNALTQPGSKMELHSNAERAPQAQKPAASTNTAAAIAGLKPWSKDWVMQGGVEASPELRPLFGKDAPQAVSGQLAQDAQRGSAAQAAGQIESLENLGSIEQVGATQNSVLGQSQPVNKANPNAVGGLSGAEFLNVLSSTRSVAGQNTQNAGGNASGNGAGQGNQGQGKPDLRVISGGKEGAEAPLLQKGKFRDLSQADTLAGSAVAGHLAGRQDSPGVTQMEVKGHVTQGAMAQERLTNESLSGITSGLKSITAQGSGEMRVRLNPENLGELRLHVMTSGNNVSLRIQATDDKAKRILEESLSHLKESMASQSLVLGQVDVAVAQMAQGAGADNQQSGQQSFQHHAQAFDSMMGQSQNQNSQRGWSGIEADSAQAQSGGTRRTGGALSAAFGQAQTASQVSRAARAEGRLDVIG